ncbi:hypothetical protein SKAU_G00376390 [Synaphobranchus kaupii]|uniref:Uncharacterized protein n=1 Tax=Synaphobranchus kaupii TaxID=118154 RepID=A0A9Q1IE89_SYNKA|nr:hypothetical protein SKAU_G00376390 [Synaphobranchus kaupii]
MKNRSLDKFGKGLAATCAKTLSAVSIIFSPLAFPLRLPPPLLPASGEHSHRKPLAAPGSSAQPWCRPQVTDRCQSRTEPSGGTEREAHAPKSRTFKDLRGRLASAARRGGRKTFRAAAGPATPRQFAFRFREGEMPADVTGKHWHEVAGVP